MSTTGSSSKRHSSSESQKTDPGAAVPAASASCTAADVTGAECVALASTSAQLTAQSKRKGKKRKRSPKDTKPKKAPPLQEGVIAEAGTRQPEVGSHASVPSEASKQKTGDLAMESCPLPPLSAADTCTIPSIQSVSSDSTHSYGQKEPSKSVDMPPTSDAPRREPMAQHEAVTQAEPGVNAMTIPASSPAASSVLLLYPAASLATKNGNTVTASTSEIRTGKYESTTFSRRRETSLPNLNAVPSKSSLARRNTVSLTNTEKRARFSEAPIVELVLLSLTQISSGRRSTALALTAAAAVSVTLVLTAIVLYALLMRSDTEEDVPELGGCTSTDCRHHAALIVDRLNLSLDPCHDFAAFACSAWSPPPPRIHREFPSARDDVVVNWARDFENILVKGSRYLPTGEKAKRMFEACAYDATSQRDASALRVLRQFMVQRGIPWPSKQPTPAVRPLGVLVDLAYKWQVPLWFSVRFERKSPNPSRGPPAVIIGPSSYTLVWFSLHKDIVRRGAFQHHWRRLHDALSVATNASDFSAQRVQQTADVDSTVLGQLANALMNGSGLSDEVKLRNVSQQYTPNISYTEWRHQLREHVLPIIDGNYLLRVSNSAVLRATDALFAQFTEDTLLENMGWFFARLYAPLADPSLLRDRHGAPHTGEEELALFCAAQVEALFRLLVISLYTVPHFSTTLRQDTNKLLHGIREIVADKVNALPWLDEASKRRAEEKIHEMGTVLWPPDNMMESTGLAAVYSKMGQPSGPSWSVMDTWVQGREALNNLDQEVQDIVMHLPANMELPLLEYDYLRNEVRVSVQALSRPVFYFEGTRAMFYGGLGFLYAAEVVRALDADGARRDASGVLVTDESWLSPAWMEAVIDREECLTESGGYFPEIPALEVAYASLEKSLVSSGERIRTARSAFSQRRLFYVTLCYLMCSKQTLQPRGRTFAGDCNKAVANFPRFAEDFGCDPDARMRRERPCVFFG